jgi:hypothetical protein
MVLPSDTHKESLSGAIMLRNFIVGKNRRPGEQIARHIRALLLRQARLYTTSFHHPMLLVNMSIDTLFSSSL